MQFEGVNSKERHQYQWSVVWSEGVCAVVRYIVRREDFFFLGEIRDCLLFNTLTVSRNKYVYQVKLKESNFHKMRETRLQPAGETRKPDSLPLKELRHETQPN